MPAKTQSRLDFELKVENFGKLAEAEIRIGDFTVLAGPNNTGKSFVSKLLYSIFSALDADLPRERVWRLAPSPDVMSAHDERPQGDSVRRALYAREQAAASYWRGEIESLDEVAACLSEQAARIGAAVGDWRGLADLSESLQQLTSALEDASDARVFSLAELQYRTKRVLSFNFQVPDMASLARDPDRDVVVNIAELLQFTARADRIDFGANDLVPTRPPGHRNVVYVESPVYWKLFDTLQDARHPAQIFGFGDRERLIGVPDYFYDLARAVKRKYTGEMAFPNVHRKLVGADVINGEVAVSETGDLVFKEAGRSFPLVTAAAGVANIGVLAMLIERKVIDHGTMLFIDEPEAHLHPAWQVVVAEALFQLAREGVRVVLATHSLDILKWLEVHLKENPNEEKHVALNRFPDPVFDDEDVATKLASIKDDLTKPFVDLYMRGL